MIFWPCFDEWDDEWDEYISNMNVMEDLVYPVMSVGVMACMYSILTD